MESLDGCNICEEEEGHSCRQPTSWTGGRHTFKEDNGEDVRERLRCSPVSFVVTWDNIQDNHELANVRNISETDSDCREHSPKIC